jgi:membrane-associated phospholipid phosphatase
VYCLPLGIAYIFVCPAIVVATVWLGYHYVIDSIPGVGIGLAISALTILIVPRWLKHVREPLTGDPCYLTAMVTFPVVERAGMGCIGIKGVLLYYCSF